MSKIKLGFEVGTGKQIDIEPSHLMVTGITAKSGKTTTLEALIHRSNKKAIVFKTKRGEKVFHEGNFIQPYFKDRSDWEFVKSLIEAIVKTKVRYFEQTAIIKICQESKDSLFDFKKIIDERISGKKKLSRFDTDILTNLQAYLDKALPKLEKIPFTDKLVLKNGLNIIDLQEFHDDDAVLSLIISSVVEEVLDNHENTIIVIPESWKFIPEDRNNPCKLAVEKLIRQGATNDNFVWLDSQDIAGVAKSVIKQVSEYILGYQAERNEVKHTLDQIPLSNNQKPKADEIMNLKKGIFFFASREQKVMVYVQPKWLDDYTAKRIALGDYDVNMLPSSLKTSDENESSMDSFSPNIRKDLLPLSKEIKLPDETMNYVDKTVGKIQRQIDELKQEIHSRPSINREELFREIMAKFPKSGNVIYEITPLEKIKKDFLETAKQKILDDISKVSPDSKQMLKYLESRNVGVSVNEIAIKCFLKPHGANPYNKFVNDCGKELEGILVAKKQTNGKWLGLLKARIIELLQVHGATEEEIDNLYNHILMELCGVEQKV